MSTVSSQARFQLCYWPIPFRGCFITYLFAFRNVPLLEVTSYEENADLKDRHPRDQAIPYMGPPMLRDLQSDRALSQMPAIVLYVSRELDLMPDDPFDVAMGMKVLMDCNDVLVEICRNNGSTMWAREDWLEFRSQRFPHWLRIFEEMLNRGFVGKERLTFADIGVFALLGNMTRCLPELEPDFRNNAPGIHALCQRIGAEPSLAAYVADTEQKYGKTYCGGQIEASIRSMLAMDAAQ